MASLSTMKAQSECSRVVCVVRIELWGKTRLICWEMAVLKVLAIFGGFSGIFDIFFAVSGYSWRFVVIFADFLQFFAFFCDFLQFFTKFQDFYDFADSHRCFAI